MDIQSYKDGVASGKDLRHGWEQIVSRDRIVDTELSREVYTRDTSYFDLKLLVVVRFRILQEVSHYSSQP